MFEHDRSAARGEMASRKLIAFEHESALGNAPAHELFDRVIIERMSNGDAYPLRDKRLDNLPPARSYADYRVTISRENLPKGSDDPRVALSAARTWMASSSTILFPSRRFSMRSIACARRR
jgi:hypothetical protein